MEQYTRLIMSELGSRAKTIKQKNVSSIYFGGGTPSLLPPEHILAIHREISNLGFAVDPNAEITIEINPGTVSERKLDLYLEAGINRFSVGVQTFNDSYLAACGREHNAECSRETLRFLERNKLSYSFDLLFGLPNQTKKELQQDLDELLSFSPQHVSLYNLTVPQSHKMNALRAEDDAQAEMFEIIDRHLAASDIHRYEISNFARPGYESKHNQLYWSDSPYWGLGVSAHSYFPEVGDWGTRFWNPNSHSEYVRQVSSPCPDAKQVFDSLPERQIEFLKLHESATDYCHTQLRMMRGLSRENCQKKFGHRFWPILEKQIEQLLAKDLLVKTPSGVCLSPRALPIANRVFLALTFLSEDFSFSTH